MNTSDFAQRHGFQEERTVFKERDYLPTKVREHAGEMMVEHLSRVMASVLGHNATTVDATRRFVRVLRASLPAKHVPWEWYEGVKRSMTRYSRVSSSRNAKAMRYQRLRPLKDCEWPWFYTVVENVCTSLGSAGTMSGSDFASELSYLLRGHGIPWRLQGGLVVPADEYEFAEELEYVGQVTTAADVSDPRVPLKKAFVALFRKQGGPDIPGACLHAWSAWETAREAAGGPKCVESTFPELWDAVTAWKKLIHAARHSGKKEDRQPTEEEARFIVGLLTNAVRLVSTSAVTEDVS